MTSRAMEIEVGRRLASARMRRGVSQGTLSRLTGIAPSYLSRIETGKVHPTFHTVMRVASALRISLEELAGEKEMKDGGRCPVTQSGRCLLDHIRSDAEARRITVEEVYGPRQIRLLQRFASWLRDADASRVEALETLLGGGPASKTGS